MRSLLTVAAAAAIALGGAQTIDLTATITYATDAAGTQTFLEPCTGACARGGFSIAATTTNGVTAVTFTPVNAAPTGTGVPAGCTCGPVTGTLNAQAKTVSVVIPAGTQGNSDVNLVVSYNRQLGFMYGKFDSATGTTTNAGLYYNLQSCVGLTAAGQSVCAGSAVAVYVSDNVASGNDVCARTCAQNRWNVVGLMNYANDNLVVLTPTQRRINNCTCEPLAGVFANNAVTSSFTSNGNTVAFTLTGFGPTATQLTATFSVGNSSLGSATYAIDSCTGAILGVFCQNRPQTSSNGLRSGDLATLPAPVPAAIDSCSRACVTASYSIGATANAVTLAPRVTSPFANCVCNALTGSLNEGVITVKGALALGSAFVPTVTATAGAGIITMSVTATTLQAAYTYTVSSPGCVASTAGFCGDTLPPPPEISTIDGNMVMKYFDQALTVPTDACAQACITGGYAGVLSTGRGVTGVVFNPLNVEPTPGCECPTPTGRVADTAAGRSSAIIYQFSTGAGNIVMCNMTFEATSGTLRSDCSVDGKSIGYVRFLLESCIGMSPAGRTVCLGTATATYVTDTLPAGPSCPRSCGMNGYNLVGLTSGTVVLTPPVTSVAGCSCTPLIGTYANGVMTGSFQVAAGTVNMVVSGFGPTATQLTVTYTGALSGAAIYALTTCTGGISDVFCLGVQSTADGGARGIDFVGGGNTLNMDACSTGCIRAGYTVNVTGTTAFMNPRTPNPFPGCWCPVLPGTVSNGAITVSAPLHNGTTTPVTLSLSAIGSSRRLGEGRELQTSAGLGIAMSITAAGRRATVNFGSAGCRTSTSAFCGDTPGSRPLPPSSSGGSSSSSNAGAIAGGVIGGIAGAVILAGLVYYFVVMRGAAAAPAAAMTTRQPAVAK